MIERSGSKVRFLQVFNNSAAFVSGELFYRFVNFFSCILIARSLGGEKYGQFSFIYIYLSVFEVFVQFGMNSIVTRHLSCEKDDAPRILGNAILLRLVFVVLSIPISFFVLSLFHYPEYIKQCFLLASFQLFLTIRTIYETVFRVNFQMIYPAIWNAVRALLSLALVVVVFYLKPVMPFFILAYVVSGLLGLLGLIFSSKKWVRVDFRFDPKIMSFLLKESGPLVISAYLTLIYYRVDVFMLSFMKGFRDVGYYTVATRITESLTIVSSGILVSLFPLLARSFKSDQEDFIRLVKNSFKILMLAGFPIALGGSLVGRELMAVLFGKEYEPSGLAFSMMCWYTFFCFIGSLLSNILVVSGRQLTDMWLSCGLALLNAVLNFFLIPTYGFNGAAAATVMCEFFAVFFYLFYVVKDRSLKIPLPFSEILLMLKVSVPLFVFLLILKSFDIPVLLTIPASVFLYCLTLFLFKIVTPEDLKGKFTHGA